MDPKAPIPQSQPVVQNQQVPQQPAPSAQEVPVLPQPAKSPVQKPIQHSWNSSMQPPQHHSSFGIMFFWIIVVFLIIGAGVGGYYLAMLKRTANITPAAYGGPIQSVTHSIPTPTMSMTPASTDSATIDTSAWKTYRAKGYSVKYPNTWLLMSTNSISTNSLGSAIWIFNPATMKDESGNGGLTGRQVPSQFVTIEQIVSTQTPKQYVDTVTGKWQSTPGEVASMDVKSATISGLVGESYIEPGEGSRGRITVVSNGNIITLFNASVNDFSQDKTINAIISSFK